MNARHQIARAAWIFVGLELLVGLNGPFGLGLCIAEDGHTSIELSHANRVCGRDARRHHADAGLLGVSERDRHPCVDVPLLRSRSRVRMAETWVLPPAAAVSVSPARALDPPTSTVAYCDEAAYAPPPSHRTIRSVVLVV